MKPDCHPNELALYWTLSQDEHALLANKTGAGRPGFALLLACGTLGVFEGSLVFVGQL